MGWNYELKCANELRRAIRNEEIEGTLTAIYNAYVELKEREIIDKDDFERYTEDFALYEDMADFDDPVGTVDYELDNLYDLCDNLEVWIEI